MPMSAAISFGRPAKYLSGQMCALVRGPLAPYRMQVLAAKVLSHS
jgi:hypothetical protein